MTTYRGLFGRGTGVLPARHQGAGLACGCSRCACSSACSFAPEVCCSTNIPRPRLLLPRRHHCTPIWSSSGIRASLGLAIGHHVLSAKRREQKEDVLASAQGALYKILAHLLLLPVEFETQIRNTNQNKKKSGTQERRNKYCYIRNNTLVLLLFLVLVLVSKIP